MMWMSVPQMPQAPTRRTTSSGPGSGSATSTTRTLPGSSTMTAFMTYLRNSPAANGRWLESQWLVTDKDEDKRFRPSRLFHSAHREAAHKLPLRHPADHDDRKHGHSAGRGQLCPEQSFRRYEANHEHRHGRLFWRQVERKEEFIPGEDDRDEYGRDEPGRHHWKHDLKHFSRQTGTIDPSGVEHIARHLFEE